MQLPHHVSQLYHKVFELIQKTVNSICGKGEVVLGNIADNTAKLVDIVVPVEKLIFIFHFNPMLPQYALKAFVVT